MVAFIFTVLAVVIVQPLTSCKPRDSAFKQVEGIATQGPTIQDSLQELKSLSAAKDRLIFADGTVIEVDDYEAVLEKQVKVNFTWSLAPEKKIHLMNPKVPLQAVFLKSTTPPGDQEFRNLQSILMTEAKGDILVLRRESALDHVEVYVRQATRNKLTFDLSGNDGSSTKTVEGEKLKPIHSIFLKPKPDLSPTYLCFLRPKAGGLVYANQVTENGEQITLERDDWGRMTVKASDIASYQCRKPNQMSLLSIIPTILRIECDGEEINAQSLLYSVCKPELVQKFSASEPVPALRLRPRTHLRFDIPKGFSSLVFKLKYSAGADLSFSSPDDPQLAFTVDPSTVAEISVPLTAEAQRLDLDCKGEVDVTLLDPILSQ